MLSQGKITSRFSYGTISINELFSGLDRCQCKSVASIGEHLTVPPSTTLFASGDRPGKIFLHRSGCVLLFWSNGMKRVADASQVDQDRIYGLIEALSGDSFDMTVQTVTKSEFDVMGADDLFNFVRKEPDLCFKLTESLSSLCRTALQNIKSH